MVLPTHTTHHTGATHTWIYSWWWTQLIQFQWQKRRSAVGWAEGWIHMVERCYVAYPGPPLCCGLVEPIVTDSAFPQKHLPADGSILLPLPVWVTLAFSPYVPH